MMFGCTNKSLGISEGPPVSWISLRVLGILERALDLSDFKVKGLPWNTENKKWFAVKILLNKQILEAFQMLLGELHILESLNNLGESRTSQILADKGDDVRDPRRKAREHEKCVCACVCVLRCVCVCVCGGGGIG